jgi:hypothetical protein
VKSLIAGRRPRTIVFALGLLLCILAGTAAAGASPTKIQGRWTPGVYHLGNLVPLEIAVPVRSSDFYLEGKISGGEDWGKARIARVLQAPPASYPGDLTLKVEVQVFDTGEVQLPPTELDVHTAKGVEAFSISVPPVMIAPLLPPGDQPQPDPAEPMTVPFPFPWIYLAGAAVALFLLGTIVFMLVRRATRRRGHVRVRPSLRELDPDLWIRREVERLFRAELEISRRYEALSTNVRTYLEIKFGLPFLEWTSSEIREGCMRVPELTGPPGDDLTRVLRLCDGVLFARYVPTQDDESDAMQAIVRVLEAVSAPARLEKAS